MKYAMAMMLPLVLADSGAKAASKEPPHASCFAREGTPEAALCDELMLGVAQGIIVAQQMRAEGAKSCIPDDLSQDQAVKIEREFMKRNPVKPGRRALARNNAWDAFTEAYPCQGSK